MEPEALESTPICVLYVHFKHGWEKIPMSQAHLPAHTSQVQSKVM